MNNIIKLIKQYQTFIKYMISAGISFILDLGLFTLFNILLKTNLSSKSILVATILARAISSFINYLLNRNRVFKQNEKGIDKITFIYYLI